MNPGIWQRSLQSLAVGTLGLMAVTANAGIVRGIGGTSNDGNDDDIFYVSFLTSTDATEYPLGSLGYVQQKYQSWSPVYYEITPRTYLDNGVETSCYGDAGFNQTYRCEYAIGAGEYRLLEVISPAPNGYADVAGFTPAGPWQVVPTVSVTLAVTTYVNNQRLVHEAFTYDDVSLQDPDGTIRDQLHFKLPLRQVQPGSYILEMIVAYSVPSGFGFYDGLSDGTVNEGEVPSQDLDVRTSASGMTPRGQVYTVTRFTALTIDANSVPLETVPPVSQLTMDSAPNAAGWYSTLPQTGSITASDSGGSGIASIAFEYADSSGPLGGATSSTSPLAVVISSGQGAVTIVHAARDNHYNVEDPQSSTINVDTADPVVSVTGVAGNATYQLGNVPTAACTTTDALSGVATSATVAITGGTPNGVGQFTATCSGAVDLAGNAAASVSVTYKVVYPFNGFFSPVDNPLVVNRASAGQTVPFKFSLGGDYGLDILAGGSPVSFSIPCAAGQAVSDIEEAVSSSGSVLSYDPASGQYLYKWKTPKNFRGECRAFALKLDDGETKIAYFTFK